MMLIKSGWFMATAAMALLINGTASVPDPQATNGTLSMPTATPAVVPPTTVAPPLVSVPIQDICDTIPNLPICSLSRQCSVAPVCQAYASYPNLCNDPGVWYFFLPTCREAQLPDVQYAEPLNILNTTYILDRSNSICSEMPNMAGCSMCTFPVGAKPASACDLASVYGSLCRDMPDMKQCDGWVTFCDSYADSHRAICGDRPQKFPAITEPTNPKTNGQPNAPRPPGAGSNQSSASALNVNGLALLFVLMALFC